MNQRIDYEIDPNSSFNKLKKLQISLKEENALKDIFYDNKDELLKKIEKNCYEYYKERIKIQHIYDNNNSNENINNNNNYSNSKNYLIKENAQSELPQCYDVIYRILFLLRSNNKLLLELIENIDYSNYEIFSNFLCHYFYNNIFSSTYINEYLLVLIYLLLEKEVDKINENNNNFLDDKSFVSKMLINLSRKLEIKNYMENIIKDIICDIEDDDNINNNNNNNIFFGMKHDVIKNYLDENKFNLMQIKNINNYKEFLFTNIKKSKIYLKNNSQNENNNNNGNNNKENNNNENNTNIENDIYKEEEYIQNFYENLKFDAIHVAINSSKKKQIKNKEKNDEKEEESKITNEIEKYLISTNLFDKILSKSNENNVIINKNEINDDYLNDLTKEELIKKLDECNSKEMEEFLINQINFIEENNNDNKIFTIQNFLEDLLKKYNFESNREIIEQIIIIYKYNFEKLKNFIDNFLLSLINNVKFIPFNLKCICKIIEQLILIKFPNFSSNKINYFISEFFFNNLFFPILINPFFNGIILKNFINNNNFYIKNKIESIILIINKLLQGKLFNANEPNEKAYAIFNTYFIEILPSLFKFFDALKNVELPIFIQNLINERKNKFNNNNKNSNDKILNNTENNEIDLNKLNLAKSYIMRDTTTQTQNNNNNKNNSNERKIDISFLEEHPEEHLEHQSICLNWSELIIIYETLKKIENNLDKNSLFYKSFKKLTFQEKSLYKKENEDSENNSLTYIFLSNIIYEKKLKEKMNLNRSIKFNFESNENLNDLDKEKFILIRVKYCITTIIKNLNLLTRENFFIDEKKEENFVHGLNKIIELEGFNEILREKTIPLNWFGLYLQSNIEKIPIEYKRSNYKNLYDELIKENQDNLNNIKNDDSLNILYSKIINIEKLKEIVKNNVYRMENYERKIKLFNFIFNTKIQVYLIVHYEENIFNRIEIKPILEEENNFNIINNNNSKIIKCKNIKEFIQNFPNISENDSNNIQNIEQPTNMIIILNEYFEYIFKILKESNIFSKENETNLKQIQSEMENFIHKNLYIKLYNEKANEMDNQIFKKCSSLNWILPKNLIKNYKINLNENLLKLCIQFVNNFEYENCPNNKLENLNNIIKICENLIDLYGYEKEENLFNIILYVIIKSMPKRLFSNVRYVNLFLNKKLIDDSIDDVQKIMNNLTSQILDLKFENFFNVEKEEFEKNCEKNYEI